MPSQNEKTLSRCLTCGGQARVRGLCPSCRSAAWRAVARGKTSEEELIRLGLLLPRKQPGRPSTNGFMQKLRENQRPVPSPRPA